MDPSDGLYATQLEFWGCVGGLLALNAFTLGFFVLREMRGSRCSADSNSNAAAEARTAKLEARLSAGAHDRATATGARPGAAATTATELGNVELEENCGALAMMTLEKTACSDRNESSRFYACTEDQPFDKQQQKALF